MNKTKLNLAIASIILSTSVNAEVEITGNLSYEGAAFTKSGQTIGYNKTTNAKVSNGKDDNKHNKNDIFKNEIKAKFLVDGDIGDESTWHMEVQGLINSKSVDDHQYSYTQNEALREAYIDTNYNDWFLRFGKQQTVWGTGDGTKILDVINPTDYSEMAQNRPADARIPTWMINAEKELENGGNIQIIASQPRENIFAGLNREIDTSVRANNPLNGADLTTNNGHEQKHPFKMLGVDSITGERNGFLNGVPDLGSMAAGFVGAFTSQNLVGAGATTVGFFGQANNATASGFNGFATGLQGGNFTALTGAGYDGAQIIGAFATPYNFNLTDANSATDWSSATNPDSMFEYMDRTSFASFNTYMNAGSQYNYDMPDDTDLDLAMRWKDTTNNGLNYSFNYSYNYDKNPVLGLSWHNNNGEQLNVSYDTTSAGNGGANAATADSAVIVLTDSSGNVYGGLGADGIAENADDATPLTANLRFTQTLERAHNIGGSFDTSIETESLGPIVLRGEAVYQKDVYSPVFDRGKLAIGDLVGALKMKKGDRLKYAIGADFTFLTNMLVSTQFIQDRNLDYIDDSVDFDGSSCDGKGANCGVYTADFATMHMSNGFQKAEKNKEFYSLYLSKPFGSSDEHRWNNIFMFEENGGKWNRFDVEYSINDEMLATFEWNKYFGDENTQFGQLANSSNIQLGFKYTF
jgi:hypothetical protein